MYTCIFSIKNLDLAVPMKNKREHKSSTYSSWAKNIKMLIIEKNLQLQNNRKYVL